MLCGVVIPFLLSGVISVITVDHRAGGMVVIDSLSVVKMGRGSIVKSTEQVPGQYGD